MFPVSGAVQFIATLHKPNAPRISQIGAYSNTLSLPTSGKKKLYKPLAFAFCRSSSKMGGDAAHTAWLVYVGSSCGDAGLRSFTFFTSSLYWTAQIGIPGIMSSLIKLMMRLRTSKKFLLSLSLKGSSSAGTRSGSKIYPMASVLTSPSMVLISDQNGPNQLEDLKHLRDKLEWALATFIEAGISKDINHAMFARFYAVPPKSRI